MASTSLIKLREQVNTLRASKSRAVQHARRGFKVLGDLAVIGGTGLAAGFVQGRYGAVKIPRTNVPLDLTLAGGFYIAGLMEPFGENASHQLFNIAHGLSVSHLVAVGRGAGKTARAKAGKPPLVSGQQDADLAALMEGVASGGGTLSEEDLVRLATSI